MNIKSRVISRAHVSLVFGVLSSILWYRKRSGEGSVRLFMLLLVSLIGFMGVIEAKENRITKAFCHEGAISDKIVFLFAERPVCTYVPQQVEPMIVNENGFVQFDLFFPVTSCAARELYKIIAKFNTI